MFIAGVDNEPNLTQCVSSGYFKIGAVLLLLLALLGPVLQMLDYFNDAHALDHDAVLHTVEALLCFAFTFFMLGSLMLWLMKASSVFQYLPQQLETCFRRRWPTLLLPSFDRPSRALRI